MLILEIISGKRNSSFYQSDEANDLLSYVSTFSVINGDENISVEQNIQAWKQRRDGLPLEFVDPMIRDSCSIMKP